MKSSLLRISLVPIVLIWTLGYASDQHESEDGLSPLSTEMVAVIALAEVIKRERWLGEANTPVRRCGYWTVIVWEKPSGPGSSRMLKIGDDATILSYDYGH
jgi:hypothetical protein